MSKKKLDTVIYNFINEIYTENDEKVQISRFIENSIEIINSMKNQDDKKSINALKANLEQISIGLAKLQRELENEKIKNIR